MLIDNTHPVAVAMKEATLEDTPKEKKEPRRIEELLHLDTYQGMTDEEIAMVINWQVQSKLESAAFTRLFEMQKEQIEQQQAASRKLMATQQAYYDKLIADKTPLETVTLYDAQQ